MQNNAYEIAHESLLDSGH